MNDIFPMWVAGQGTGDWYQAPAALKLMMDRLVCADGGNPNPTLTQGKDAERAKQLDLEATWQHPRHLEGGVFTVVVHGDSAGAETLCRILT